MWLYNGKEIKSHDDLHPECTDIVYCIIYDDNTMYVGKKVIRSKSILPVLKTKKRRGSEVVKRHILRDESDKIVVGKLAKKQARNRGLTAKVEEYEEVLTDKPFLAYTGSSKETEGLVIKEKHIIYQCTTKKAATYLEAMTLFDTHAIFSPEYRNLNVLGSFYDSDLDGLIED